MRKETLFEREDIYTKNSNELKWLIIKELRIKQIIMFIDRIITNIKNKFIK